MPLAAKPVYMEVRPFEVSHLCFEVGGILGESFVELGSDVSAFDFAGLYKAFRAAPPAQADRPDRLAFDSDAIDGKTIVRPVVKGVPQRPPALAALRAEPLRAALDKAVNARANAVIGKYANAVPTIANMREVAALKTTLLSRLSVGIDLQTKLLFAAYEQDGRTGDEGSVVKFVHSSTASISDSTGSSDTPVETTAVPPKTTNQHTDNKGHADESQQTTTREIEYKVPSLECLSRNERVQISLRDEQFANFMQIQNLERLEEVFKNELASIDTDINQLQHAYLNTILMSPIKGTVTGVYKNPGDSVSAGEPIFRVENNDVVLIMAKLVCRGPVSIGNFLEVGTVLFDQPGAGVNILAEIVAARGQSNDEQWEVVAKVSNVNAAGKRIFPLGYHFDYDNTRVVIDAADEV